MVRTFILLAWALSCLAQSPTFEAASVKPATPPVPDAQGRIFMAGPTGGPGTADPGRIHYPGMTLKSLVTTAYDVRALQVVGPAWLDTERFEINAKLPANTTKEQFRVMLQNLLAERFKLTIHRESKDLPVYTLEVVKGGPKLKESAATAPPEDANAALLALPATPKRDADGFPVVPELAGRPGLFMFAMPGRSRVLAQQQTMQDLAARLSNLLNRSVTDATGLKGKYDFTLTFSPEGLAGPGGVVPPPSPGGDSDASAFPDIFGALQAQLGLKLESKKGPVEMIVIDHVEKAPTEN